MSDKRISVCDSELEVEYFKAEVLSAVDYYPFGMMMPDRQWYAGSDSGNYRFGFNGQEKDDELKGAGNSVSFRYRIHDARLGRFFTVDPLRRSFPHNSPYCFSENRVIDGIDLEGSEYLTFHFEIYGNGSGAVLVRIINYRNAAEFNYDEYSESFGPEGRGVKYVYHYVNESGQLIGQKVMWAVRQNDFNSNTGRHGLFMGAGCITRAGPLFDVEITGNDYAFEFKPIDEVDNSALTHDIKHSEIDNYQGWLEDSRTLPTDKELVQAFSDYALEHTGLDGYTPTGIDRISGRTASNEAIKAATSGFIFFTIVIQYKEWKVRELENLGLDPYAVENQLTVTIDDYKGKWWQFKRNAAYKILKAAEDPPK